MLLPAFLRRLRERVTPPVTHTLVCGASRSGKSEAELARLLPLAARNDCSVVVMDPPGTLARKLLLHLDAAGQTHRVLYDRLADTDHVPGYEWLAPSRHPDPLQRASRNDERVREFTAVLLRRRGIRDSATAPLIEEWLLTSLRLFLAQEPRCPLPQLADVFDLRSPVRRRLLAHCTEPELVRKFEVLASLSPTARRAESGPAERILRAVCESPAFRARSGDVTVQLATFLDERGILILDGSSQGNLSRDAASIMMGTVILGVIDHCRKGSKSRVVLVLDEAVNADLIGPHESRALAEAAKWGLEVHVLVQDPFNFPTEDIRRNVLQNCHRHEWFRQGSPEAARLAAEDIAIPLLDPLRVHHREQRFRSVEAGYRKVRAGETRIAILPRRSEVTDVQERYTALTDQILLMQKQLMLLEPGWRFVRAGKVSRAPEYVRLLRKPFLQTTFKTRRNSEEEEGTFEAVLRKLKADGRHGVPQAQDLPPRPIIQESAARRVTTTRSP
jgi:hypothetical protein